MKKIFSLILIICFFIFSATSVYAADLDRITNFNVIVEPRMNDGTLDITYEITWKVLDSETEGPLSWVKIGTPNENFNNPTALTSNIKSIKKDDESFVRIDFKKKYKANQELTFKYSIHQASMHKVSEDNCIYTFTPAWFTNIIVDKITIMWNADGVIESNSNSKVDNYLVWTKTNLAKGEKLTAELKYDKNSFGDLTVYNYNTTTSNNFTYEDGNKFINSIATGGVIFIVIATIILCITGGGGGGYYGHSGFYGHRGYYSSCARSCACACACARSCACACAGSGRAGCSRKDFYGTKIDMKKLNNIMEKK